MLLSILVLTMAASPVPDAGAFGDSPLGQKRAGENVSALDERWIDGFGDGPLLARVEKRGDELAVAFYARVETPPDAGPSFEEKKRFAVPMARELDGVELRELGPAGKVLSITAHADDPDEQPLVLTVIGRGPRVVFQGSLLRDLDEEQADLALGGPEGFTLIADGGSARVEVASETKRVKLTLTDGGPGEVELGRRERVFRWKKDAFQPATDAYHDFLTPLRLQSPGHAKLVDGSPTTSERIEVGKLVVATLPPDAKLRIVRVVPGCLESESKAKKQPAATRVQLQLDASAPIEFTVGEPVADARLFGSGEFTLGKGYGTSEMLVFEPPISASQLTVKVLQAQGGANAACLAEIAAY